MMQYAPEEPCTMGNGDDIVVGKGRCNKCGATWPTLPGTPAHVCPDGRYTVDSATNHIYPTATPPEPVAVCWKGEDGLRIPFAAVKETRGRALDGELYEPAGIWVQLGSDFQDGDGELLSEGDAESFLAAYDAYNATLARVMAKAGA
jgi:hypothetical protein